MQASNDTVTLNPPRTGPDTARAGEAPQHPKLLLKQRVVQAAIERGLVDEEYPLVGFIDIEAVGNTVVDLISAFPAHFRHTFAAKANSLHSVLRLLQAQGIGCEVASPGELAAAVHAGFSPDQIVFDAPAKTPGLIRRLLQTGVALNIDNFQELQLIEAMVPELSTDSVLGIRINPQVGVGNIEAMSTATPTSKFGIGLEDPGNRARILEAYRRNTWLTSLHTHIGSQGCSLELMLEGIGKVLGLAEEINENLGHRQVTVLDIGGGLPVNFSSEEISPSFTEYAGALEATLPLLFNGGYRVKTEFGRALMAKNGILLTRVEYTKQSGGRRIATTHAGAQIAARTVFMPGAWPLRVSAFDGGGTLKSGPEVIQDIAGPCCFAGDILAHQRRLPLLERGDYLVAHDTGAYYFSNPFFYNSLPMPAVYGYRLNNTGEIAFDRFRAAQSPDQVLELTG